MVSVLVLLECLHGEVQCFAMPRKLGWVSLGRIGELDVCW